MGDLRFARCLQGGGVAVFGGSVSIVNSQIYSNTAAYVVRADETFKSSHRPGGKIANSQWLVDCREAVPMSILARSR